MGRRRGRCRLPPTGPAGSLAGHGGGPGGVSSRCRFRRRGHGSQASWYFGTVVT